MKSSISVKKMAQPLQTESFWRGLKVWQVSGKQLLMITLKRELKKKNCNCKANGKENMPVALIAECTALSVEEVQKILKENGQLKRDSQIISGSFFDISKVFNQRFRSAKKRKRLLHPFLKIMFEIMFAFFKSNSSFPVDNVHFFCHFSKLSFQGLMPIMFIFFRFSNINALLVQHIAFY